MKSMALKLGLMKRQVTKDKKTGEEKEFFVADRWYNPIMGVMGMNRVDNEVSQIVDKDFNWIQRVINVATGIKIKSASEEKEIKRLMKKMIKTMFDRGELGHIESFFGYGELTPEQAELLRSYNQLTRGRKSKGPPKVRKITRGARRGAGPIPSRSLRSIRPPRG